MSVDESATPLLGLLLRLAAQQWATDMDAALQAHGVSGLTPAHAKVIPFVPPEGIQIGELAQLAKVRKQSMASSVDLLTTSGHVTRRPDPNDGRASLIFLTDKGRALRPASRAAGEQVEEAWADIVGRDHMEHLRQTLTRLLHPDTDFEGESAPAHRQSREPADQHHRDRP
ncbi:MarR family transcriptional regulator [Dactylosporangium vinaceum]|uniref:MarR family winged helix-turn-helix transcriptional regulator n=1 Tax=Dactylosporangium vinaceum TaxID=53362 RepID=A0ABV5M3T2_9ACTN|nr:MarR family transcriptional regulator [Dactylosporangium vinaceum]UAB94453.1 MarR family transcriptional regulator [Dactylosporangium vinaceum]